MNHSINTSRIPIGVVGLGLMVCSISTCLLMAGHPVVALAPIPADVQYALPRIQEHLHKSQQEGLVQNDAPYYLNKLTITEIYSELAHCQPVIECTLENLDIKQSVYQKTESVISADALLVGNTSAIPISVLPVAQCISTGCPAKKRIPHAMP